jgi:hypothetical protein
MGGGQESTHHHAISRAHTCTVAAAATAAACSPPPSTYYSQQPTSLHSYAHTHSPRTARISRRCSARPAAWQQPTISLQAAARRPPRRMRRRRVARQTRSTVRDNRRTHINITKTESRACVRHHCWHRPLSSHAIRESACLLLRSHSLLRNLRGFQHCIVHSNTHHTRAPGHVSTDAVRLVLSRNHAIADNASSLNGTPRADSDARGSARCIDACAHAHTHTFTCRAKHCDVLSTSTQRRTSSST